MWVTFTQAMEARFESHAASAARRAERLQAKVASLEESLRAAHWPDNNETDDDDSSTPAAALVPSSAQQRPRATSPSPLGGSADVVVSSGTAPLPSPALSTLTPPPSTSSSMRPQPTVRAPDSAGDYATRLSSQAAMAAMTTAFAPPPLPRSSPPPALYTVGGSSSSSSTAAATTLPLSRRRTHAPSDDGDAALANLMAMNERLLSRLGEPVPSTVVLRTKPRPVAAAWSPLPGRMDLSSPSTMGVGWVAAAGSALPVNDGARGALAAARAALDVEEAEAARTGSPAARTPSSPPPWRAPTPGAVAPAVRGGGGGAVRRATNKKGTSTPAPSARSPPPGGSRRGVELKMMAEITALKQQCADLAEVVGIQTTPTRLYY